jgi:hypothetical protein
MYGWLRSPIYRMMIRNETKLFWGSIASIFGRVWIAEWPDNFEHGDKVLSLRHGQQHSRIFPRISWRVFQRMPYAVNFVYGATDLAIEMSHEACRKCTRDEMRETRWNSGLCLARYLG